MAPWRETARDRKMDKGRGESRDAGQTGRDVQVEMFSAAMSWGGRELASLETAIWLPKTVKILGIAPSLLTSTPSPWPLDRASMTTSAPSPGRMAPPPPSPSRIPTSRPLTARATKWLG
eukprot:750163-Hanusia_phi.AAC.8